MFDFNIYPILICLIEQNYNDTSKQTTFDLPNHIGLLLKGDPYPRKDDFMTFMA